MTAILTEDDVRAMIRERIGDRTLAVAGAEMGVSAPWLCQILKGQRVPSGKVLDMLGIERHSTAPRGKKPACFHLVNEAEK